MEDANFEDIYPTKVGLSNNETFADWGTWLGFKDRNLTVEPKRFKTLQVSPAFQEKFLFVCLVVFNTTFNNISVISWRSVLLVEETGGPRRNQFPEKNEGHFINVRIENIYIKLLIDIYVTILRNDFHCVYENLLPTPQNWVNEGQLSKCYWWIVSFLWWYVTPYWWSTILNIIFFCQISKMRVSWELIFKGK